MAEKMYPHWLRAIRIREDACWIIQKNVPRGTWNSIFEGDMPGPVLGDLSRGHMSRAVTAAEAERLALMPETEIVPGVQLLDVYGTDMRALCLPVLRVLEEAGAGILGVSLSTQRMSLAVQGCDSPIDLLYGRFSVQL